MRLGIYWLLLFACVIATLTASAQAPSVPVGLPFGSALVVDLKGDIAVSLPPGLPAPVRKGQLLPTESNIETNKGTLVLAFADGSQVLIKPQARVILKSPEQSNGNFLELLLGKLLAKVQKRLGQEPSFKLGTPTAVITVRGTFFGVEVTKKLRTRVQVYEGVVEVLGLTAPSQPIRLQPGFATEVDGNGSPQNPHRMREGEDYTAPGNGGLGNDQGDNTPNARNPRRNPSSETESGANQQSRQSDSQRSNSPQQQQQKSEGPD
jgi:hypothetical protein